MIFDDLSTRSTQTELMDDPSLGGTELEETVDHVERVNKLTFGSQASLRGIASLVPASARELSVMDIGTGNGGLARDIARWARGHSLDVRVRGIDINPDMIDYANRQCRDCDDVEFELLDLFDVQGDSSCDIVHASNMLHHLDGDLVVDALRKMRRIARRGVVIADLHRHPLPWLAMKSTIRLISGNRFVRNDAPLSVARGFTRDELDEFARRAGFEHHCVAWHMPFRWLLIGPTGSDDG